MTFKTIKNYFYISFAIAMMGYLIYKIARNSFTDHFLGENPQRIKAVIINEKNFMGNQPVDPKFSYSYSFRVSEKQYTGNTHDRSLKIGDTIEIKYNKDYPSINKPLHPKE